MTDLSPNRDGSVLMTSAWNTVVMDERSHDQTDQHTDEGEYYGEIYGSNAGFEWFWWGATWLTVPLFVAYLIYRIVT